MMFKSLDEVHEFFQLHPQSAGKLRLDHYLVLEATHNAGERFVKYLESQGMLPITVAWVSQAGRQIRLYQNPFEGNVLRTMGRKFFGLQFRFGSRNTLRVPNNPACTLDFKVAALPQKTLQFFFLLWDLAGHLLVYLPVPRSSTVRSWQYRRVF